MRGNACVSLAFIFLHLPLGMRARSGMCLHGQSKVDHALGIGSSWQLHVLTAACDAGAGVANTAAWLETPTAEVLTAFCSAELRML